MPDLANGFLLYAVFLLSTTFHEAAHAWAALRGGDLTAFRGGQVTLDPRPHIRRAPIGMVVLPIISVLISGWPLGFASAPYDPQWAMKHPNRAGWMALAGPGANLILVLLSAALINAGVAAGVFMAPETIHFSDVTAAAEGVAGWWGGVAALLGAVFALNLLLFIFNLIPVPPLDGSAALVLLLPPHLVPRYQQMITFNVSLSWIGIFLAWQLFDPLFKPFFTLALKLLYPDLSYG
ncbi:MAG: site-2 protease family protein [Gemmatimonadaceae bacterium]